MILTLLSNDGSQDICTITKADYDRIREKADEIHVVRNQTNTSGDS